MSKPSQPRPSRRVTRRAALKTSLVALAAAPVLPRWLESTGRAADASKSGHESAVVTVHPEADAAAHQALAQGGNAVDAAIAAMLTLCVLFPDLVGVGGYGGSMAIYLAGKRHVTSIDFDSRAPLGFKPEMFSKPEAAMHGYLSIGVPGILAGFDLALKKHGKLSWKQVTPHARQIATDGFSVDARLAKTFKDVSGQMDPTSFKAYFPDGQVPVEGTHWVQPDLARLLDVLAVGGAKAFYHGDIAQKIVRQVQANGGILTEKDFAEFKVQEVTPSHVNYRGYDLHTPPPPSGGLTALSIIKTLEQFDVPGLQPWGADYFHLFAEACKLCWAERFSQFGDPDSVKFSEREMLSIEKAKARAQLIRDHKVPVLPPLAPAPNHTANVVIIDKDQNMVSMTATQGGSYGSHVVIGGLGLVLGHGMGRFTLEPASPNYPAPGKRMQHNMSPMLITKNGRPVGGLGLPGGRMIVTVTAQLALGALDFKTTADTVVTAPRVHTEGAEPLAISKNTPEPVVTALEKMGHKVQRERVAGPANLAVIDPASGKIDSSSGRTLEFA